MLIQSTEFPPAVIALQETGTAVKLPGYKAFQCINNPKTAVLVQRNVPAQRSQFDSVDIPHDLVVLFPPKRDALRIFILNIYSSPKDTGHKFNQLFSLAKQAAQHHMLIIAGDFNAPHTAWGYSHCTKKGRLLWEQIQAHRLIMESDSSIPTRIGNSVQKDSSPDLTITHKIKHCRWTCTDSSLGSDHLIIQTDIFLDATIAPRPRQIYFTNWHDFRNVRANNPSQEVSSDNFQDWVGRIISDARLVSTRLDSEIPSDVVDSRLQHMWEAFKSIQRRWRKNKHNRKLRLKLAELTEAIQNHAAQLARDQWGQICDQMRGNLSMKRTWSLLRHLLDPERSKTTQINRLSAIVHNFQGTNQQLLNKIRSLYIPVGDRQVLPSYSGAANAELDAEITEAEVRAALLHIRPGSAAGPDGITNKMLRNLDDQSISTLTKYYNHFWRLGALPQSWKHAKIALIPKPGKPLNIEHLRPISLTSCVAKVLEHIIHVRLTNHLISTSSLPHSMIGFRSGLCTQDILLQLSREVITPPSKLDTAAILALDLTKAFDRVSHTAILQGLATVSPGERTYNYIRDFLTSRTAIIQIGDVTSDVLELPSVGTPQGAVLSPLLFNLALLNIPKRLERIPHLHFSLYADDITLWVPSGSDALIEEALQAGAQVVVEEARAAGLNCSPEKSELLLLPPKRRSVAPPNIKIQIGTNTVPTVESIKILGLLIQRNRANTQFISQITSHVNQTIGLIRRITTRHKGLKEEERLRLVQAFVISRITYSLPYLHVTKTELKKIDCLIRKAYKAALQVPMHASTARLERLGVYNTAEELVEAHHINQLRRLSATSTGRYILDRLQLRAPLITDKRLPIPRVTHACLIVRPIPRNMHPIHHKGRREQRARELSRRFPVRPDILYVDAADYRHHDAFAVAVVNRPNSPPVTSLSVRTTCPATAEETAIALALTQRPAPSIVISDSKTAIQNFARGLITPQALQILSKNPPTSLIELVWTPAHTGVGGNEAAHATARELTIRAGPSLVPLHGARSARDSLLSYHDLVTHYRLTRRAFPPAHVSLNNAQERTWRLLQTDTLPCRAVLHHIHPTLFPSPNCPLCGALATVSHSMWACPNDPFPNIRCDEQWEGALGSSDPGIQISLVNRATAVAARLTPAATPPS